MSWPLAASPTKLEDVAMAAGPLGVDVSIGLERYLVPWSAVQCLRYADVAAPTVNIEAPKVIGGGKRR